MSLPSNFVNKATRLALYKNADFHCVYCDEPIERDIRQLSLDHLHARSKNGEKSNPKNLVCSCNDCNVKKGNKTVSQFARLIGLHPKKLKSRINKITKKPLDTKSANSAIRKHGYLTAIAIF